MINTPRSFSFLNLNVYNSKIVFNIDLTVLHSGPKTGADVLFIMNYPAYIGEESADVSYHTKHPGLGYKYTSDQVCFVTFFNFDQTTFAQIPR